MSLSKLLIKLGFTPVAGNCHQDLERLEAVGWEARNYASN